MVKIRSYASDDGKLRADVLQLNDDLWIEFLENDVVVHAVNCEDKNVVWAQDVAKNFSLGKYNLNEKTWRVDVY